MEAEPHTERDHVSVLSEPARALPSADVSGVVSSKDPILVAPRATHGQGYARFPRPRRKPLPSSISNVVSLLPPSPIEDETAVSVSISLDTVIMTPSVGSSQGDEEDDKDAGSVVESRPSLQLHVVNPTQEDSASENSFEPQPNGPSWPTDDRSNSSSSSVSQENSWSANTHDSTVAQEQEVLSMLDSMSLAGDKTKSAVSHVKSQFKKGRSKLPCTQSECYSYACALDAISSKPSAQARSMLNHSRAPDRRAFPSYFSPRFKETRTSHVNSTESLLLPKRDQNIAESVASRISNSPYSLGPPSSKASQRWNLSPQLPCPPSPDDHFSTTSSSLLHGDSVGRHTRMSNSCVNHNSQEESEQSRPGRNMIDYTLATSVGSDESAQCESSATPSSALDSKDQNVDQNCFHNAATSIFSARDLINLFEKGLGSHNISQLQETARDDPSTRASSSCYTATVRPRMLRASDLLGANSALSYDSPNPNLMRQSSPLRGSRATSPQKIPLPTGLVQLAGSETISETSTKERVQPRAPTTYAATPEDPQKGALRRKASLPLTDLAPRAFNTVDLPPGFRESKNTTVNSFSIAGTTSSYRRQKEGRRSASPERAVSMVRETPGPPLQAGQIWYYDVHSDESVARWVSARARLFEGALALSWLSASGGRENVVLGLDKCSSVHSLPSEEAFLREGEHQQDMPRLLKPFQFVFDDGVERVAVESIRERAQWVARSRDALAGGHIEVFTSVSRPLSPEKSISQQASLPRESPTDSLLERISDVWRSGEESAQTHRRTGHRLPSEAPTLPPKDIPLSELGALTVERKVGQPMRSSMAAGAAASLRPSLTQTVSSERSVPSPTPSQIFPVGSDRSSRPRRLSASHEKETFTTVTTLPRSVAALTFSSGDEIYPGDSASQCTPVSDAGTRAELPDVLQSPRRPRSGSAFRERQVLPKRETPPADPRELLRKGHSTAQVQAALETAADESNSQIVSHRSQLSVKHRAKSPLQARESAPSGLVQAASPGIADCATVSQDGGSNSEVFQVLNYLDNVSTDDTMTASFNEGLEVCSASVHSRGTRFIASTTAIELHLLEMKNRIERLTKMVQKVLQSQAGSNKSTVSSVASARIDIDLQSVPEKLEERSWTGRTRTEAVSERQITGSPSREMGNSGRLSQASAFDRRGDRSTYATANSRSTPQNKVWNIKSNVPSPELAESALTSGSRQPAQRQKSPQQQVPNSDMQLGSSRAFVGEFVRGRPAGARSDVLRGSPPGPRHASTGRSQVALDIEAAVSEQRAQRAIQMGPWQNMPTDIASHISDGNHLPDISPSGIPPSHASGMSPQTTHKGLGPSFPAHISETQPMLDHENLHATQSEASNFSRDPVINSTGFQGSMAAECPGLVLGLVAELERIVKDLKYPQGDREKQGAQQADIARNLNKLNTWLEQDVDERNKDFRGMQEGIGQLKEEVAALKAAVTLPVGNEPRSTFPIAGEELPQGAVSMPEPAVEPSNVADSAAPVEASSIPPAGPLQATSKDFPPEILRGLPRSSTPAKTSIKDLINLVRREWDKYRLAYDRIKKPLSPSHGYEDPPTEIKNRFLEAVAQGDRKALKEVFKDGLLLGSGVYLMKLAEEHQSHLVDETGETVEPTEQAAHIVEEEGSDQVPEREQATDTAKAQQASQSPSRSSSVLAASVPVAPQDQVVSSALDEGQKADAAAAAAAATKAMEAAQVTQAAQAKSAEAMTSLLQAILEQVKAQQSEAATRETERLEAEKKRQEESWYFFDKQAKDIVGAFTQHFTIERRAREEKEAEREQQLDPKTAIEALVEALNYTRNEEAAKREQTNRAVAELAAGVERSTERQHERLLHALTALSRDVVCTSVENHLQHFKGAMATSFASSAQAMAEAWTAHAQHVASMPRATLGAPPQGHIVVMHQQPTPPPAKAAKDEKPKEEKPSAPPTPAPPQPPPPRPLGPYGCPPRWG